MVRTVTLSSINHIGCDIWRTLPGCISSNRSRGGKTAELLVDPLADRVRHVDAVCHFGQHHQTGVVSLCAIDNRYIPALNQLVILPSRIENMSGDIGVGKQPTVVNLITWGPIFIRHDSIVRDCFYHNLLLDSCHMEDVGESLDSLVGDLPMVRVVRDICSAEHEGDVHLVAVLLLVPLGQRPLYIVVIYPLHHLFMAH